MARCQCDYCKWSRYVIRERNSGSRRRLLKLIDTLRDRLLDAEGDVDYYEAILDGSYPSAVEHLENSLRVARYKQEERNEQRARASA